MSIDFEATDAGFEEGLGGASNIASTAEYHYVLFGEQVDELYAENTGVYFEYDDQSNGTVNGVRSVVVEDRKVTFELDAETIVVRCRVEDGSWDAFLRGIEEVFPKSIVSRIGLDD